MILRTKEIYRESVTSARTAARTPRIPWVDHARGIAIMLVVYRHVVIGLRRSGIAVSDLMYNVQEVFYNFRMPVFFVLSGLFVAGSLVKRSRAEVLKDRASTILYPYLVWAVILISLETAFSSFTNSIRDWHDFVDIIVQPRDIDHLCVSVRFIQHEPTISAAQQADPKPLATWDAGLCPARADIHAFHAGKQPGLGPLFFLSVFFHRRRLIAVAAGQGKERGHPVGPLI